MELAKRAGTRILDMLQNSFAFKVINGIGLIDGFKTSNNAPSRSLRLCNLPHNHY